MLQDSVLYLYLDLLGSARQAALHNCYYGLGPACSHNLTLQLVFCVWTFKRVGKYWYILENIKNVEKVRFFLIFSISK